MPALIRSVLARWTVFVPPIAVVALLVSWGRQLPTYGVVIVAVCLAGAVLAAVHHAEVVAHAVGEPFGSLVLAVAVTVIEVALIVTLMADGGAKSASLARDTVFAAVMITCNGIVGAALLVGTLRHRVVAFNAEGAGGALATVATLATLSLVLPRFTTTTAGPQFSPGQLAFAGIASLVLYGLFVAMQTVRHRDYFLPVATDGSTVDGSAVDGSAVDGSAVDGSAVDGEEHAHPPGRGATTLSLVLLLVALVAVVGDAKAVSPAIEAGVAAAGMPPPVVGVVIALLVLAPETIAAVRAARAGRMQTSLNLAYGSAMASIGLTIPAIAVASTWLSGSLLLGLGPVHMALLAITVITGVLTVVPGRATLLQSGVHLALFAGFVVLAVNP